MKNKRLMHPALPIALVCVLLYLAVAGWIYLRQDSLVYHPDTEMYATPADQGWEFTDLTLETPDGLRLHAWFIPAPREQGVVLFCHGNAGNISLHMETIAIFRGLGLSTLIFDYRGFGRSQGRPSEAGTYLDARTAWDYLTKDMGVSPDEIILVGRSLGGAVAAHLASDLAASSPEAPRPRALILESTFTSLPDMAARLYPWLPVRWLTTYSYNTLSRMADLRLPVLVVHSPEDELVPYSQGQALFAAAGEPKIFLDIRGNHNSGFLKSGPVYTKGLADFLRSRPNT
jgi:uncharacterized protein